MVSKQDNIKAIQGIAGKRGNKVISGARKATSGFKKAGQAVKARNLGGVISGVRKGASGIKRASDPAKKMVKGLARKTKNTGKEIKKFFV